MLIITKYSSKFKYFFPLLLYIQPFILGDESVFFLKTLYLLLKTKEIRIDKIKLTSYSDWIIFEGIYNFLFEKNSLYYSHYFYYFQYSNILTPKYFLKLFEKGDSTTLMIDLQRLVGFFSSQKSFFEETQSALIAALDWYSSSRFTMADSGCNVGNQNNNDTGNNLNNNDWKENKMHVLSC